MQNNREQSRVADLPSFGDWPQVDILWGHKGEYVTFGFGKLAAGIPMRLWDPMTGKVVKEVGVVASYAKLNKDGTKLLAGMDTAQPKFRIYDTDNWNYKEFEWEGPTYDTVSWTTDDKAIVVGFSKGKEIRGSDGHITRTFDCIARLIDPFDKQAPRTVMLAPGNKKAKWKNVVAVNPSEYFDSSTVNFAENKVAFGSGHIKVLDGVTLETLYSYAPSYKDLNDGKMPSGFPDKAFSPDGKYLYIVGSTYRGGVNSLVLDGKTGTILGTFEGGATGFTISRDGKQMALGKLHTVELFSIQQD
jgi:hypothetical protein